MIPKIIHFCWFGHNAKPKLAEKCIKSWKKYLPDYQFIEWNENNYDIFRAPLYVRQACERQKWAFVTDYVRLDVVFRYGGVYLDTDVEIIKPIDNLLKYRAFFGFENDWQINTGLGFGAESELFIIKKLMSDYENISFIKEANDIDMLPCPYRNKHVFEEFGFKMNGKLQVKENIIALSKEYLCPLELGSKIPKCTNNTYAIHWYSGSWASKEMKKKHRKEYLTEKKKNIIHYLIHIPNRILNKVLGKKLYQKIKEMYYRNQ